MSRSFEILIWSFVIATVVGIVFNIAWAVVFWNSQLFIWHWLGLPLGIAVMIIGGVYSYCQGTKDKT